MFRRRTILASSLCVVLLSGGYLVGEIGKSSRATNRELYTPTRIEWAEVWLRAGRSDAAIHEIETYYSIEDSGGEKEDIICVLVYVNSIDRGLLLAKIDAMRNLVVASQRISGIDVNVIEHIINQADPQKLADYGQWRRLYSRRVMLHKQNKR